jgi:Uncharacterised protein family (UPF0158)
MPPVILLSEFVAAIQFGDANAVAFLETRTGRLVSPEEAVTPHALPTPGYEPLPFVTDRDELAFARQFAATIEDPRDRQRLELALASGNAHEAFEMAVFRCQIANEWFQYRDQHVAQFAKNWLDARGLSYTDDVSHPAD